MNLQFIHDNRGNTTGVFITIEEWQTLKTKYADLQKKKRKMLWSLLRGKNKL